MFGWLWAVPMADGCLFCSRRTRGSHDVCAFCRLQEADKHVFFRMVGVELNVWSFRGCLQSLCRSFLKRVQEQIEVSVHQIAEDIIALAESVLPKRVRQWAAERAIVVLVLHDKRDDAVATMKLRRVES